MISLSAPPAPDGMPPIAGGATAADGSLRVVLRGMLFAIDLEAQLVRWSRDLHALAIRPQREDEPVLDDEEPTRAVKASLPTLLDDDRTLVTVPNTAVTLDARGELCERVEVPLIDDSGPSTNTDLDGRPILTTIDGAVHVWHADGLRTLGTRFGYDIVPVGVFADGTFAVSGYAGSGFCRVGSDGRMIWRADLDDADLLPTVSRTQHSAVGSLNDECSVIFDPEGRRLGTYPAAAVFAEYEADRGWIALAADSLARLTSAGEVRWRRPLGGSGEPRWGCYQPIVDASGTIYVVTNDGIAAFDGEGEQRASLVLGDRPMPLIPVRAGVMATIVGDALFVVD